MKSRKWTLVSIDIERLQNCCNLATPHIRIICKWKKSERKAQQTTKTSWCKEVPASKTSEINSESFLFSAWPDCTLVRHRLWWKILWLLTQRMMLNEGIKWHQNKREYQINFRQGMMKSSIEGNYMIWQDPAFHRTPLNNQDLCAKWVVSMK